jgi:soluble lytic murein transglycosylase-like protein
MSKTFQSTILSLFLLFGIHTESSANTVEWIRDVCDDCSESYAKIIMHSVHVAAMEYDVDPNLILKVIKVESRFNPKARGSSGSIGLMQIIPKYHKRRIKGRSLINPQVNIDVGTSFLAEKLEDCGGNARCALMKYNASYRKKQYATDVLRVKVGT